MHALRLTILIVLLATMARYNTNFLREHIVKNIGIH